MENVTTADGAGPVGLIGLGLIGTSLAKRLLGCGFAVHGFDIVAERRSNLRTLGGIAAESARDVGRVCRVVLLAVFDTPQVQSVLEGAGGLGPEPGQLVICTSTCDPDALAALGQRLDQRRVRLLEAPLSGNSNQIALGNGVAMIGGERAATQEAALVLAAISKQQFHLGPVGSGGRAKVAVNLVEGLNRAVLAAERVGQELPLARLYTELIESCIAHGEGELDNSAVIQELRRRRHQVKR